MIERRITGLRRFCSTIAQNKPSNICSTWYYYCQIEEGGCFHITAQKISFTSLYRRNAEGVWYDLPSLLNWYPIGPLIVFIQVMLLPVTLTIGAGIKSLVDYFTRKPLFTEDYSSTADKLSIMTEDEIENCAEAISNKYPMPTSKLSNALIELLASSVDEGKIRAKVQSQIKARKITRATECFKTQGISISSATFDVSFSKAELEDIDKCTAENLSTEKQKNTQNKRDNLVSFFTAPHNTGKKMQHAIMEVTLNKGLK